MIPDFLEKIHSSRLYQVSMIDVFFKGNFLKRQRLKNFKDYIFVTRKVFCIIWYAQFLGAIFIGTFWISTNRDLSWSQKTISDRKRHPASENSIGHHLPEYRFENIDRMMQFERCNLGHSFSLYMHIDSIFDPAIKIDALINFPTLTFFHFALTPLLFHGILQNWK